MEPGGGNHTHCVEGTWGAQIIDDLKPQKGEHLVVKKGFGGFLNTPLDTVLRNKGVTTCLVSGVTTCVCVSTTVRGGVEYNYRMILATDAVADFDRDAHEAELRTMASIFADVKTTDEVVGMLGRIRSSEDLATIVLPFDSSSREPRGYQPAHRNGVS
jgi:ureidoacrylate peracid hydrolase